MNRGAYVQKLDIPPKMKVFPLRVVCNIIRIKQKAKHKGSKH